MPMGTRRSSNIHGAWLVRVLAASRKAHACQECGARMFVKAPSGLCPVCFTRRRLEDERVHEIASEQVDSTLGDWGFQR
jgi:rubrerythrin